MVASQGDCVYRQGVSVLHGGLLAITLTGQAGSDLGVDISGVGMMLGVRYFLHHQGASVPRDGLVKVPFLGQGVGLALVLHAVEQRRLVLRRLRVAHPLRFEDVLDAADDVLRVIVIPAQQCDEDAQRAAVLPGGLIELLLRSERVSHEAVRLSRVAMVLAQDVLADLEALAELREGGLVVVDLVEEVETARELHLRDEQLDLIDGDLLAAACPELLEETFGDEADLFLRHLLQHVLRPVLFRAAGFCFLRHVDWYVWFVCLVVWLVCLVCLVCCCYWCCCCCVCGCDSLCLSLSLQFSNNDAGFWF
mmetsp:Transcript_171/g.431  ORF Transcript_171/g.431 Transcript_171/m.431 type:complete len:307 (+) Transcript_171:494-1414(+)